MLLFCYQVNLSFIPYLHLRAHLSRKKVDFILNLQGEVKMKDFYLYGIFNLKIPCGVFDQLEGPNALFRNVKKLKNYLLIQIYSKIY